MIHIVKVDNLSMDGLAQSWENHAAITGQEELLCSVVEETHPYYIYHDNVVNTGESFDNPFIPSDVEDPGYDLTVTLWQGLSGFSSHLKTELCNAPEPSLYHLMFNLLFTPCGRHIHIGNPFTVMSSLDIEAFIQQIFMSDSSTGLISQFLHWDKLFPIYLCCDLLTSLDLAISNDFFPFASDMMHQICHTLVDLSVHFSDKLTTHPEATFHLRIDSLHMLR
ncbi:uncharacterized protein EV420DRAFT_1648799 [Desarmillaria tabescens]|uniref:Uncharacterized protein n=1 Tax=Armillaria tabescens TaxID=1929756 RepID=A0AA39JKP5_ARMTA|nr:uncharacterized protein EV420DRAFT_1648799 [Desarmillaria tabescens]KAK0444520.1 hypothetical protein EV420DRAFT_1648799 [Desarmillaria tabescens]